MGIRKPSGTSSSWLYQDFLYQVTPEGEERYLQVKWDGEPFSVYSETFDQGESGGNVKAQIDYTKVGQLVTINDWQTNWRDEWPLRLGLNYLINCLYPKSRGFLVRVEGEPHPFWVSETFEPVDDEYLYRF